MLCFVCNPKNMASYKIGKIPLPGYESLANAKFTDEQYSRPTDVTEDTEDNLNKISMLEVDIPVTLSWQDISVFVKVGRKSGKERWIQFYEPPKITVNDTSVNVDDIIGRKEKKGNSMSGFEDKMSNTAVQGSAQDGPSNIPGVDNNTAVQGSVQDGPSSIPGVDNTTAVQGSRQEDTSNTPEHGSSQDKGRIQPRNVSNECRKDETSTSRGHNFGQQRSSTEFGRSTKRPSRFEDSAADGTQKTKDNFSGNNIDAGFGKWPVNRDRQNCDLRFYSETPPAGHSTGTELNRHLNSSANSLRHDVTGEMEDVLLQTLESFQQEERNNFLPDTVAKVLTMSFQVTGRGKRDIYKLDSEITNSSETLTEGTLRKHTFALDRTHNAPPERQRKTLADRRASTPVDVVIPSFLKSKFPRRSEIFQDFCVNPPGYRQVLFRVSGLVQPGCLLGILGAKGSAKTTLLNVLTCRNLKGKIVTGAVRVNGITVDKKIRNISAYVQQHDLFIETLTVRETLMFRAKLKLDSKEGSLFREERVNELLEIMGLTKCADSRIGTPGTTASISGGEAKRLSFACEMLTNPPLMFCDEPTSGLDTYMAFKTVSVLKDIAALNHTVICVIHQPSSQVFALFDEIILMAEGRVAFMGTPQMCRQFFADLGAACPPGCNPADFYIHSLAIVPGREIASHHSVYMVCRVYLKSEEACFMKDAIRKLVISDNAEESLHQTLWAALTRQRQTWCGQFSTVMWRSWVSLTREKVIFRGRGAGALLLSIVLGLIFLRLKYDQKGVMDFTGAIFVLLAFSSSHFMHSVLHTFTKEIPIFMRDYESHLYRADVYYLAKSLAELPTNILLPAIMITIDYFMIGFYLGWRQYLTALAVIVLTSNIAVGMGHLFAYATRNISLALALTNPVTLPLVMLGGYLLNDKSIPLYILWVKYLSWFRFGNELLVVNQFHAVKELDCPESHGGTVNLSRVAKDGLTRSRCHYADGAEVLELLNFSADHNWFNWGMLIYLFILFRVVAFLALLIRTRLAES